MRRGYDRLMQQSQDALLAARLADERGRRVAFVSHCLLNENTRYLGGAFKAGAVPEVVNGLLEAGVGISQMPCPEQRAWGGVAKRLLLRAYGIRGSLFYPLRRALLRLFVTYTRVAYAWLARGVAREIADYQRSGYEVVGVIGVGSSPSCGVSHTLDMRRSLDVIAACPIASIDRATINQQAVASCRTSGEGIFTQQLRRRLDHLGIEIPFIEYDIVAEMRGEPQDPVAELLG